MLDAASAADLDRPAAARAPVAVVIGSGFGGLAAAVRLAARGWRVTVLEALDQPGGRARVHRQDGFSFDAGPTIVTAPFLLEELWALAGRRLADDVTLKPLSPFYRLRFDDGSWFSMGASSAETRAEVARINPADLAGYDRFMALSEQTCRLGFEQLGFKPFSRFTDMLKVAPGLLRLRAWRSVHAAARACFRDDRLRTAFSFHPLLIGGNPFSASAIYALISSLEHRWGVHWAMGGTGALTSGLAGLLRGMGGTLRLNAPVAQVLVQRGRAAGVLLESGEAVHADIVVSNADAAHTYGTLLGRQLRRRWTDGRLARARPSMSLFVWYFGTSRRYEGVDHHSILLGPRYRGLLDDIFRRHQLAHDPSLYLHRPTATDTSLAPPGCDAFYVLAPVPNLRAGIDWESAAEPLRKAIQQRLEATVLPGLGRHIVTSRLATPLEFRDTLRSPDGAGFGLEPVLTQSAWFRPHNVSEELRGLYLVGAGTHPGAGLPGVLSSAKLLDQVIPHAHAFVA